MTDLKILVGADPEVFVKKGGKYVTGYGLIDGDKANPVKVDKGAVQVDGMALEFNIDPAASEEEFITNIDTVMNILAGMVPDHVLAIDPVAYFEADYMASMPQEALDLGCDPDYNGWGGLVNPKPDGSRTFRTGAGHVHIGLTSGQDYNDVGYQKVCADATKQMDFFLGLPSLMYDGDTKRREMYGKAGAFRPKHYGFEYRTLSNAWLREKKLMSLVYNNTIKGMREFLAGNLLFNKYDVQDIINSSDKAAAKRIMDKEGIPYVGV